MLSDGGDAAAGTMDEEEHVTGGVISDVRGSGAEAARLRPEEEEILLL
jgi:hypothetical protein